MQKTHILSLQASSKALVSPKCCVFALTVSQVDRCALWVQMTLHAVLGVSSYTAGANSLSTSSVSCGLIVMISCVLTNIYIISLHMRDCAQRTNAFEHGRHQYLATLSSRRRADSCVL